MFCFGLQSIARFINPTRPTSTHSLEAEENFPETFKSQWEKK